MHIELHEKNNSDIYIYDRYEKAKDIVYALEESALFRRVFLVNESHLYKIKDEINNKAFLYAQAFYKYLSVYIIVPRIVDIDIVYEEMFFPCHILATRLVRFYYIKKNYPTKYYMFDEGVGSYRGQFEHSNAINTIIKRVLFGKEASRMSFDTYLFRPELLITNKKDKININRIESIDELDSINYKTYCDVFKGGDYSIIDKRVVFFDGIREELFLTRDGFKIMDLWYKTIERELGASNMLVKPHPRAKREYNYDSEIELYYEFVAPIEIDYLKCELNNMVFISVASTAVISPKLLFDKEPIVLLLCCVNEKYFKPTVNQLNFYKKVKEIYRRKDRFFMPHSINELQRDLKTIKKMM